MAASRSGADHLPITRAVGTVRLASEFSEAASRQSFGEVTPSFVTYFLLGHSIELSLKAFLIAHGISDRELRALGHDLISTFDTVAATVRSSGRAWSTRDRARIELLSPAYDAKGLEYVMPGALTLPDPQELRVLAERLVSEAQAYVHLRVRSCAQR